MPLIQHDKEAGWGIWKIEETSTRLLSMLDKKEWYLPFLNKHTAESRQTEWLAVRVLLKALLGRETYINYLEYGVPYLPTEKLHISISHTKGYAAVILNSEKVPGIDIEYFSDRVERVVSRFMNPQELLYIDESQRIHHLLLHWSAKETLFKILLRQEVDFSKHLIVSPFVPQASGTLVAQEFRTAKHRQYPIHYLTTDQYVMTYYC